MREIKVDDLWEYPIGSKLNYDHKTYYYLGKSDYGYYLFDGYRADLHPELKGKLWVYEFNEEYIKETKNGIVALIGNLLDEPDLHTDTINYFTKVYNILGNLQPS